MWNGVRLEAISVGSGVPQGSSLAGKFFNLLMDRALNMLQEKGLGCHVDAIFAGAVAYADDLILLLPSLIGMQLRLNLCSNEFNGMELKFNVSTCVALVIGETIGSVVNNLVLYGVIPWSKKMCYLGLYFKAGNKLRIDILNRCGKFIGSIASVLRGRRAGAEDIYVNVIKTRCLPILFNDND